MPKDVQGKEFVVGQKVARAAKHFTMDGLYVKVCEVTRIEDNKVYLDGSNRALNFPNRVAIIG